MIEDDHADQKIFKRKLSTLQQPHELFIAESLADTKALSNLMNIDAVFCDYNLPDGNAIDFLESFSFMDDASVIILTATADLRIAVDSLKRGAIDFLSKEQITADNLERILNAVKRQKAENKLRRDLEKRLDDNYANTRAILNNTSDGIWSLDTKGKLLIINQLARVNIKEHYNSAPRVGDNFFENVPPIFRDVWLPMFEKALNNEQTIAVNAFNLPNASFYLESNCSPILNKGVVQGVTFFVREVTERERSEQKIRENERNFRSIFEGSDVPILVESRADGKIIDLNEACAHLHGYSVSKMIGMHVYDLIPEWHLEEAKKGFDLYQKGKIDLLDSYLLTSDKKSIPVQISVAPIAFNNEPAHLIFYQDISARKETEKKLQEAKELAEKSAEFKSLFLANMSHEIRTPLNALVGFADLLESTPINEQQKEYINIIQKSGEDLLVIINDILDLSKIEAGKMKIRPRNFSLEETLQKVFKLHQHRAQIKGLDLSINIDNNVPLFVHGDDTRISQILNNLINNAIKFTEKGRIEIKVSQENKFTVFNIIDTGIGMNGSDLLTIFENFSQVDSGIQRKHHGTGLGLSIVKQLVELMSGQVSVNSTINQGSNFCFKLPFKPVEKFDIQEESLKSSGKDLQHLRILVCEDHEVNIKLMQQVLSKFNVTVAFAKNGQEGIDKTKSFSPHVIFMDLQMPVIDGYEATKTIKTFSNVPIYALSAHVLEEEQAKCEQAGMQGFIPKPFKKEDIINILSEVGNKNKKQPDTKNWHALEMPTLTNLADGDADFANSLFDIFITSTNDELSAIVEAEKQKNHVQLAQIAHKIKPSLLTFEFKETLRIAEKIESKQFNESDISQFKNLLKAAVSSIVEKQKSFNT